MMKGAVITRGFWHERLEVNAHQAIYHQWEQLQASGCIHNFRIAAGESEGVHEGWFFADSDAYKWLEAAARILQHHPDGKLEELVDGFIALLGRAQMPDGYLFTYNQIFFPGTRWKNLQIEHELYCHGHLIEAGVSHYLATGKTTMLEIARRAADRIVADFRDKGALHTCGHEEIELALLRLYEVTGERAYLEMAQSFLERRGRAPFFGLALFAQNTSVNRRARLVQEKRQAYRAAHPDAHPYVLPPGNVSKKPWNTTLRWYLSALSGKYFQQHAPLEKQTVPVGHAVRFGYLQTAAARWMRLTGDERWLEVQEQAWERMVLRRMYLTGGLGAVPGIEGFGRDDELDPELAYAETCAALASMFWNWELAQITGKARYSELFEWQLYNAASVGMGLDGTTYLYNNPLTCRGGVERRPWYAVPCCPSNLSRTFAWLGDYLYSAKPGRLYVHQYLSSDLPAQEIPCANGNRVRLSLQMDSQLPWHGHVVLRLRRWEVLDPDQPAPLEILLRLPSWAENPRLTLNGQPLFLQIPQPQQDGEPPADGYDPRQAVFLPLSQPWAEGDTLELRFDLPIRLRHAAPRLRSRRGKVAVTRGPLVYCAESLDHPGLDLFRLHLEPDSLEPVWEDSVLGRIIQIQGRDERGNPLTLIPYFLWGNRGPSQMTVWLNG
ncbi:glycoside hydrolase family 127 protein [Anaerolinea thermophila]|uniref:Glycoside hydrolase family 127 protein n=1 Tax=Anaerolinea thermophila (strain DSM 14523 / JCM 11388 / NBRC 100420 / UNI-1) TaxID=926569 RepID=E8MY35_ANATU|nr:beta-L-arabinofuranosidase domain-containing protein [Anaerolinea thermophila]BAJ64266.1 hypothetical protein ANT_22400 [Anaerolinea thermophila UNI-1]